MKLNLMNLAFLVIIFLRVDLMNSIEMINGHDTLIRMIKKFVPITAKILEAGAHDGRDTLLLASAFPGGCVYAFEPVLPSFYELKKRVAKLRNVNIFNCALGEISGNSSMYISNYVSGAVAGKSSSSLLRPGLHGQVSTTGKIFNETQIVKVMTVDQWLLQQKNVVIDFAWLDTQGTELQILKASPNFLSNLKAIYTEVEFVEAYEKQPLFTHVKNWLLSKGFILYAADFNLNKVKDRAYKPGDRWFGNVLFVKK